MLLLPRLLALIFWLALLAGCQTNDLAKPPPPLGDFVPGINVSVVSMAQKGPLSREVTTAQMETAVTQALADRFGRDQGNKIDNIGIAVERYLLDSNGSRPLRPPQPPGLISAGSAAKSPRDGNRALAAPLTAKAPGDG